MQQYEQQGIHQSAGGAVSSAQTKSITALLARRKHNKLAKKHKSL